MNKLVDIFLQPSKVFADERERPTFLVPAIVLAVLAVAFTLVYFNRVDPSWLADHMLDAKRGEMTAKELAKMKSMMPGARTMGMFSAVGGPIGIAVMFALMGLYYWLASKVTGAALRYRHGLSLTAWSSMPAVLGSVIALVGALTMVPQTSMESLMLTHVDPLFVNLPAGAPGSRLAKAADLLSLWTMFLGALGWRVFTRSGWGQAILVAVLPYLVIYGVMALLPG
jgi:hypothetical protein